MFQIYGKENFRSASHVGARATLVCNNASDKDNRKMTQVPILPIVTMLVYPAGFVFK
jgi:hypothetical protein